MAVARASSSRKSYAPWLPAKPSFFTIATSASAAAGSRGNRVCWLASTLCLQLRQARLDRLAHFLRTRAVRLRAHQRGSRANHVAALLLERAEPDQMADGVSAGR